MKLSVIIPVYCVEETLRRCVDSVAGQEYNNLEIILVDDGSPDSCGKICDDFAAADSRISVIHKANGGLSDARNAGIAKATGEYVTFVDSDDYLEQGTYSNAMKILAEHPEYDILEFPVYIFHGSRQQHVLKFEDEVFKDMEAYWYRCRAYKHAYAWNKIYKRRLFSQTRFPEGRFFEDMYTLPLLLEGCRTVATTSKGLYYYEANGKGITSTVGSRNLDMLCEAHLKAMERFGNYDTEYLTHIVNIQLDVYRTTGKILLPELKPRFGFNGLPLQDRIKVLAIRILGIKTLCKIYKAIKAV